MDTLPYASFRLRWTIRRLHVMSRECSLRVIHSCIHVCTHYTSNAEEALLRLFYQSSICSHQSFNRHHFLLCGEEARKRYPIVFRGEGSNARQKQDSSLSTSKQKGIQSNQNIIKNSDSRPRLPPHPTPLHKVIMSSNDGKNMVKREPEETLQRPLLRTRPLPPPTNPIPQVTFDLFQGTNFSGKNVTRSM